MDRSAVYFLLYVLIAKTIVAQAATPADSVYATDKQTIAKGQQLFGQNCSACHNFLQKGIGPNLSRVTADVSYAWLRKFIRNAPDVIGQGDARATRLVAEYNQIMPAFPTLNDADVRALMAYIHHNKKLTTDKNESFGTAIADPVPAKIAKGGLRLTLEEVVTAPASATQTPAARINKMLVLPGQTERTFVVDLRGALYEMAGVTLQPYFRLPDHRPNFIHAPGLATGFGSFAFHPAFYQNGLLYTTHTEKARTAPANFAYADSIKVTLQWVLTEWKTTAPTATTFVGTGRELLRIDMVSAIHGVQEITFNPLAKPGTPDYGLLYVGVGDGGCTENGHYELCQDSTRLWGKVLRIDPRGTNSRNGQYGIPVSNPLAGRAGGEIFCRGFRNPNRICWAPNGTMLVSDIGQANMEEINAVVAGANYGWPDREGTFVMNYRGAMDKSYPLPGNDAAYRYAYPAIQYDHDEGKAVSGGFVYTGNIALLTGKYLFGDIVNGRVFYVEGNQLKPGQQAIIQEFDLDIAGRPVTFQALCGSKKTDLRFGIGPGQGLYLFTKTDGKIYRATACALVR
ncbi:PQQ-dependent sugar dehydrogenase [Spirosoma montaniterrae]|uniref:Cytochrome C n=1 Tax=Spirosoma montaniterrae TaxID=1178516 RepID=A0A1P9WWT4_9BACT|nr:PQQ-dependent sugar dehydrogenase [Spirosoma montaniterrae]AQG79831.1 cytochrome C [Spirosoma montaniterrae]